MRAASSGWDARLWALWALYSALAYTVVLAVVVVLASFDLDVTRVAVDHRLIGSLLIAGGGALLYGGVLGGLQWRVLRRRIPIPRRRWVLACVVPAIALWLVIVVPAAVSADRSGEDLRVAYYLAVSQALALGPLIGFIQARILRPYTRRANWWILANLGSYVFVWAVFSLLALAFDLFGFVNGEGSPLEAYLMLLLAAPLTGRLMLWITAPAALIPATAQADRPEGVAAAAHGP